MRTPWLSKTYQKVNSTCVLTRKLDGQQFYVLLNPDWGSWVALTQDEYDNYKNGNLSETDGEILFFRGLAADADGEMIQLDFPEPAETPSVVVVNITTKCNLKCRYCFANCEPGKGENMSDEVMRRIAEQLLSMPSETITFELQGGEPLCFLEGMKRFIQITEELNETAKKNVKYRTVTNGTLINEEFVNLIKKYHVGFSLSLDGNKDMTDSVRVYPNGRGAFDDIMSGLQLARENGVDTDGIVCTVGQHNCNRAKELVGFFADHSLGFKPRPANVLGRELESHTTTHAGEWATAFKELYQESKRSNVMNYSIHIYEENAYTPIRDYICLRFPCGAAREILSVNPDGTVFPCDGFKGYESFSMGNILKEDLSDMLQKDWVQEMRQRTASTIEKCGKCMFRGMCCSCCYSAYGAHGTIYREDPQCIDRQRIFMFLIDEWIRNNVIKKENR